MQAFCADFYAICFFAARSFSHNALFRHANFHSSRFLQRVFSVHYLLSNKLFDISLFSERNFAVDSYYAKAKNDDILEKFVVHEFKNTDKIFRVFGYI